MNPYEEQLQNQGVYILHRLPDIPKVYVPTTKELETPWYRRFENKRKKKK